MFPVLAVNAQLSEFNKACEQCDTLIRQGKNIEAYTGAVSAVKNIDRHYKKPPDKLVLMLQKVGDAGYALKKTKEAKHAYIRGIKIAEASDSPLTRAEGHQLKAFNFMIDQQLDKAIVEGQKSLEIRRRFLGETHPDTMKANITLGSLYDGAGQTKKAIECYLKDRRDKRAANVRYQRVDSYRVKTASFLMSSNRFDSARELLLTVTERTADQPADDERFEGKQQLSNACLELSRVEFYTGHPRKSLEWIERGKSLKHGPVITKCLAEMETIVRQRLKETASRQ